MRCALPAKHKITKTYSGVTYTFAGEIGVAPEWETGACGTSCQELVSACMMAHVNTKGQHIGLWIVGSSPALGWGYTTDYPFQEGSFFGNIFVSPPVANYCNGSDFNSAVVPGRLGAQQVGLALQEPVHGRGSVQRQLRRRHRLHPLRRAGECGRAGRLHQVRQADRASSPSTASSTR